MDAPTRAQLFDLGAAELAARSLARPPGFRIDPEMVFVEGSDINLQTAAASAMAEEAIRQIVLRAKALLLDGAEGEDLDRLVADRWSPTLARKQASPAVGPLKFFRTSGALLACTIPVGTQIRTASGVTVETTIEVSLSAGSNGPVSTSGAARTAGTQGNVAAGTLNGFVTPPTDPLVQVTNDEPFAGGDNRESDPALRARARAFYLAARRGTIVAIEQGALTVSGVRQAVALEELDENGDQTGRVALFVADALGQANVTLVGMVRAAEIEYRAAGVILDASGSTPVFTSIRYRLRFQAGLDTTRLASLVRNAALARTNALPPNAKLEVSMLMEVARSVAGVIVLDDAVQEPVGDLVPSLGQVFRTSAALVTFE